MNNNMKDEDIMPLSPEEIKAIGSIGIGPSKQDMFLNQHYRKFILAGGVLAVVASLCVAWYTHQDDRNSRAGAQVVAAAKTQTLAVAHPAADYDSKALENIRSEFADTASAPTGRLLEALSLLSGNDEHVKAGLTELESLANDATVTPLLRARALCAMATRCMENGDDAAATNHWNALLTLGDSPYTALAQLCLGDIAKASGKVDEARAHYTQAMENSQTSQLVLDQSVVATRLMLLDVDAPRREAPAPAKEQYANPFGNPQETTPAPATGSGDELFSSGSTLPGSTLPGSTPSL